MQLSPARPLRTFSFSASPALGAQIFDKCCCCQDQDDDCQQPESPMPHIIPDVMPSIIMVHLPFGGQKLKGLRRSDAHPQPCATATARSIALMSMLPGFRAAL